MSHSGSDNSGNNRKSSFFSGLAEGIKAGPSAYLDKRWFTLSGKKGPEEPSKSVKQLVSKAGPRNTFDLFRETYHGVMSRPEQQQTQEALGHTTGKFMGSLATGAVIGRSLSELQKVVPKRFKPAVMVLQGVNFATTLATAAKTPEYLNESIRQKAPGVHKMGVDMLAPIVRKQTAPNVKFEVQNLTSLFSHSSQQRANTGKSSFQSMADIGKLRGKP
jgi:hypothetical protein